MLGSGPAPGTGADAVLARLARMGGSADLPPGIAARAARMRAVLARPVRVTVFGLPGTGKSDVVNLLAGREVLSPALRGLPTAEVVAGDGTSGQAATELTLPDGQRIVRPGLPDAAACAVAPVFLRVSDPAAPGLARFHLVEVVTDGSPGDLAAGARWALPRTDIALWCAGRLTEADRAAWEAAPDALKDHAVMVLTGAQGPVPSGRPIRSGLPVGFRAAWPLWRARLAEALPAGDPDGLAVSGAAALVRAVDDIAAAGRAADLETAALFLSRYEPPGWAADPVPGAVVAEDPAPVLPVSVWAGAADGPAVPAAASVPDARVSQAPTPAGSAAVAAPPEVVQAAQRLRDRAADLLAAVAPVLDEGAADTVAGQVLAACTDIAGDIAGILAPDDLAAPDDDPVVQALRDAVDEVADLSVLLGIEGGLAQAADAAALLAQLRRSFDAALDPGAADLRAA
jgi:hypothetical protein